MTVGRIKTYSALTGYVWEYSFQAQSPAPAGFNFVFHVSRDRTNFVPVEVLVEDGALAAWARDHGRELTPPERFAAAKLRLIAAFDEGTPPASLAVTADNIAELIEPLGLD